MPPPAVDLPDCLNLHYVLFYQRIEQRRFTNAGHAEKDDRFTRHQVGIEFVHPQACMTADRVNRHIGDALCDFCEQEIIIKGEISLGQNDDRLAAALPVLCQIPHDTGDIEIPIQRRKDKYIVKVGCNDLFPHGFGIACGMP